MIDGPTQDKVGDIIYAALKYFRKQVLQTSTDKAFENSILSVFNATGKI